MTRVTAECPNCHLSRPCEQDEDGQPDLDLVPCQGSDTCTARMCDDCRWQCPECDLWACSEHHNNGTCDLCQANWKCNECGAAIPSSRELCEACQTKEERRDTPEERCPR